jgi:hypothetical protein
MKKPEPRPKEDPEYPVERGAGGEVRADSGEQVARRRAEDVERAAEGAGPEADPPAGRHDKTVVRGPILELDGNPADSRWRNHDPISPGLIHP